MYLNVFTPLGEGGMTGYISRYSRSIFRWWIWWNVIGSNWWSVSRSSRRIVSSRNWLITSGWNWSIASIRCWWSVGRGWWGADGTVLFVLETSCWVTPNVWFWFLLYILLQHHTQRQQTISKIKTTMRIEMKIVITELVLLP